MARRRRGCSLPREWIDPTLSRVRFGDWSRAWLASQAQLKPSTAERYAVAMRSQILPAWERVPLSAVSYADVTDWVQRLSAVGLAPATVRYAHRVMSLALDHAVHDGRSARNPAKGVRLPRPQRGEVVFLDHDQVEDLASACGGYELLMGFLAYTGLRWGEMSALRVARIDLFRRRVHVVRAFAEVRGKLVEGRRSRIRSARCRCLASWSARLPSRWPAWALMIWSSVAGRWTATEHQLPDPGLESSCAASRPRQIDAARPSPYGRESGGCRWGERQGGAADARPRLGGDDTRRVSVPRADGSPA